MEKCTNNTSTPKNNHDLLTKHHSFASHGSTTNNKRSSSSFSTISSIFCLPITSLFALFILALLAYNSFTIFFYFVPSFSLENSESSVHGKKFPSSHFSSSNRFYAMREMVPTRVSSWKSQPLTTFLQNSKITKGRDLNRVPPEPQAPPLVEPPQPKAFSKRVKQFFFENSCKVRFFMTWISSLESFGDREKFCIESLFKSHPNACLLIVSKSMDSTRGTEVLQPFLEMNFKIMAVEPDFRFVFRNTSAAVWYTELEKGNVNTGEIALGQNLSNLLRLALLYKYGGIYMDTDFIVLKKLSKLRNSIGAQSIDTTTKKWTRLNNALLIFDKKHPLLNMFIEEFTLTFDGNKWGHNGPYLVSRVIERVNETLEGGKNFTILPPPAFYVVDWVRIVDYFQEPKDEGHLKWIVNKLKSIEQQTYAVHLWNRQSKDCKVGGGSIISHLMKKSCVFCNSSSSATL